MDSGEKAGTIMVAMNLVKQAVEGLLVIMARQDPKAVEVLPEAMLLLGGRMLSDKLGTEGAVMMLRKHASTIEANGFRQAASTLLN